MDHRWDKLIKWVTGAAKVIITFSVIAVLWLAIMILASNFAESLKENKEIYALKSCMAYGVPDSLYINETVYCIGSVQKVGADGFIRGFRIALDLQEMERTFGTP